MTIPEPQSELPRNGLGYLLSGGSDLWDEGLAGAIITDEFFEEPSLGAQLWVRVAGVWKTAVLWVKAGGTWKVATLNVKDSGVWKT